MTTIIKRALLFVIVLVAVFSSSAQITSAKITYERKTNLFKKFKKNNWVQNWLKEEDKIKIDYFELYTSDSVSVFKPQESELKENLGWATSKNTVYQNFKTNSRYTIKTVWNEELHLVDSLFIRKWKISESSRKIAGYKCRKAIWSPNDSTRIYAWFSYDLTTSTGPESYNGLPGTILGLATEDGGVVYFAKKVELVRPDPKIYLLPKKKKVYSLPELKGQLSKQYGKEEWFKEWIYEQFVLW